MARVVLVHGMRMFNQTHKSLQALWSAAVLRGLLSTAWGRAHPERLPREHDIAVVYWADLLVRPKSKEGASKLALSRDDLLAPYYALLRASVRVADGLSFWDERGEPSGPIARLVNRMVTETARYMRNAPVTNPDPSAPPGAYFQVQARLQAALGSDTQLVLGHSLGSVIAYEGLCLGDHKVNSFISVGSPIATPQLIRHPMLRRLNTALNRATDDAPPWPGVRRWANFYAPADVWSVPIKRLSTAFHPNIVDVEVHHGNPHKFVETHKLASYLRHASLREEIACALDPSWRR